MAAALRLRVRDLRRVRMNEFSMRVGERRVAVRTTTGGWDAIVDGRVVGSGLPDRRTALAVIEDVL